jgi:ribonuclease P protein component
MQTFTKAERLSGKVFIDDLYNKGKTLQSFPFKINILEVPPNKIPVKIIISVPKRLFKKAVDRNRIKRLMREAYRKNKIILYEHLNTKHCFLMFIYTSKTIETYQDMEKYMITAIQKIGKKIHPST